MEPCCTYKANITVISGNSTEKFSVSKSKFRSGLFTFQFGPIHLRKNQNLTLLLLAVKFKWKVDDKNADGVFSYSYYSQKKMFSFPAS